MISELVLDQSKVLDGLVWTNSPNGNLCSKRFNSVAQFDRVSPNSNIYRLL